MDENILMYRVVFLKKTILFRYEMIKVNYMII